MRRRIALVALVLVVSACDASGDGVSTSSSTLPTPSTSATPATATSGAVTTATAPTPTTTSPSDTTPSREEEAWSTVDAERHVRNYLAALAAGAFEQAGWPATSSGFVLDEAEGDELPAETLARLCRGGLCLGLYVVSADGPGRVDPLTAQASSTVTVTHPASGETSTIRLGTFEGQLSAAGLPPLVEGEADPPLVEELFGTIPGERIVVQRFDAFEVWDGGEVAWFTNWFADEAHQVIGEWVAIHRGVVPVSQPRSMVGGECPSLITRSAQTLVFDRCDTSGWLVFDPVSGEVSFPPIAEAERDDGEWVWFDERADRVVTGVGDAEGNLGTITTLSGRDLLGDGYAGVTALSSDGKHLAFADHADPDSVSHFFSPVVVVVDTTTGSEVGRWTLDSTVLNLEFGRRWVVAWLADDDELTGGQPSQRALAAIDIETGSVNQVETPVRLFMATVGSS